MINKFVQILISLTLTAGYITITLVNDIFHIIDIFFGMCVFFIGLWVTNQINKKYE